jgi:hypothetical protein
VFAAIPGCERSLSVRSVLIAVSTLITDVIEPNDHSGRVVELFDCAHLVLEDAEV